MQYIVPQEDYIHGGTQKDIYRATEVEFCDCPLCNSKEYTRIYTERDNLGTVICSSCGLLYPNPRSNSAEENYFGDTNVFYQESLLIFRGKKSHHRDRNYIYELNEIKRHIPKGTRVIEYAGIRVLRENLVNDLVNGLSSLRYVMNLDEVMVIDAEREGNDARFINHSCDPNCEVYYFDNMPYIYAMEDIPEGEELNFDYHLAPIKKEDLTAEQKKEIFPCYCGAANCRETLISN